ncbi:PRA1A2 [Scenedesmus sp. PABB004]|nr:PRA1A2 [Scenedesmus sp. PABB004]
MDWSNVTAGELVDALREVDWAAPRPVWEFLQVSKFSVPNSHSKWTSRLKCNAYYYRTNYLALLAAALAAGLARRPLGLLGAAIALAAALAFNDPFAASLNELAVRLLRRVHPHSAALLRSRCAPPQQGSLASSQQRNSNVRVLGVARPAFVALVGAGAVYCWWCARAWLLLTIALLAGVGLALCHASLRSPNLKARLASAREEFRAVWRGYQADIAHHDYTLRARQLFCSPTSLSQRPHQLQRTQLGSEAAKPEMARTNRLRWAPAALALLALLAGSAAARGLTAAAPAGQPAAGAVGANAAPRPRAPESRSSPSAPAKAAPKAAKPAAAAPQPAAAAPQQLPLPLTNLTRFALATGGDAMSKLSKDIRGLQLPLEPAPLLVGGTLQAQASTRAATTGVPSSFSYSSNFFCNIPAVGDVLAGYCDLTASVLAPDTKGYPAMTNILCTLGPDAYRCDPQFRNRMTVMGSGRVYMTMDSASSTVAAFGTGDSYLLVDGIYTEGRPDTLLSGILGFKRGGLQVAVKQDGLAAAVSVSGGAGVAASTTPTYSGYVTFNLFKGGPLSGVLPARCRTEMARYRLALLACLCGLAVCSASGGKPKADDGAAFWTDAPATHAASSAHAPRAVRGAGAGAAHSAGAGAAKGAVSSSGSSVAHASGPKGYTPPLESEAPPLGVGKKSIGVTQTGEVIVTTDASSTLPLNATSVSYTCGGRAPAVAAARAAGPRSGRNSSGRGVKAAAAPSPAACSARRRAGSRAATAAPPPQLRPHLPGVPRGDLLLAGKPAAAGRHRHDGAGPRLGAVVRRRAPRARAARASAAARARARRAALTGPAPPPRACTHSDLNSNAGTYCDKLMRDGLSLIAEGRGTVLFNPTGAVGREPINTILASDLYVKSIAYNAGPASDLGSVLGALSTTVTGFKSGMVSFIADRLTDAVRGSVFFDLSFIAP